MIVRWMIRSDLERVLEIEKGKRFPWKEEDFKNALRKRHYIGQVVEKHNVLLGVMIYELQKTKIKFLNLSVRSDARRQGVGKKMVQKVIGKLSSNRRPILEIMVPDYSLDLQLFLKSQGLVAVDVFKDQFVITKDDEVVDYNDGYLFQYKVAKKLTEAFV